MLTCSNCGRESPDDFAFCPACAAPLRPADATEGIRKTVTVLFCDVAGDTEQTLVTGDAVNVAARLEQAAEPGSVLIGAETMRLVRDAVIAEPTAPLELKGKSEPLTAFRLVDVTAGAEGVRRRLDSP